MERLTVRDFLDSLSSSPELPIVETGSSLKDVVRAMVKGHRRRIVYVVDAGGRLKGAIALDDLKEVIFRCYLDERVRDALVVTEHIEKIFISDSAEDIMDANFVVCREKELLRDVIDRMIERDVKDIPVVDREGRVIADLDVLDLLELWLKEGEGVC